MSDPSQVLRDFQRKRIDVVADGVYIEKGTRVKVVGIEGLRVVVRAVEHANTQVNA